MLKHIFECEHLSKGLYWCFHCQRPERVGKFQCKRCQGLPSKTDRLATVARKIFSRLGTKHSKDGYLVPSTQAGPIASMALSRIPESAESEQFPECQDSFEQDEFPPYEPLPELPNNYISEMENTSVMPEMDSSWNVSPQQSQKSHESQEESAEFSTGLYSSMVMNPQDHLFSESNPPWSPSSFKTHAPAQRSCGRSVPVLALNTRDIYQPPSSRHRHGRTGTVFDEPMSATVISPLSATEGLFSTLSGREYEISPTESEATCSSFQTNDSGYASANITSVWSATTMSMDFDRIWDSHTLKKSNLEILPTISGMELGKDGRIDEASITAT